MKNLIISSLIVAASAIDPAYAFSILNDQAGVPAEYTLHNVPTPTARPDSAPHDEVADLIRKYDDLHGIKAIPQERPYQINEP